MRKLSKVSVFVAIIVLAVSMMPLSAFAYDTPLVDGGVYAITSRLSGKALDVNNSSTQDGGKVIQWDLYYGNNQLWKAVYQGDGYYKFVNYNSGKVLEVPGGNYTKGTQLQQWSWNDEFNQKWGIKYKDTSSKGNVFYTITNKMNGLVIDAAGASKENGAWIVQWGSNGEYNQQWGFLRRY